MANVSRFIRIDVRVLDNDLARLCGKRTKTAAPYGSGPVQENIDISCAGNLHLFDTIDFSGPRDQFSGNDPWRLLDLACQFERNRTGQFAKLNLRSLIENHVWGIDTPQRTDRGSKHLLHTCLNVQ